MNVNYRVMHVNIFYVYDNCSHFVRETREKNNKQTRISYYGKIPLYTIILPV